MNVRASLLLVKEFADQHDGRPGGRVVLLTSGQHLAPIRSEVAYAASKGALAAGHVDALGRAHRPRHHGQHRQPRPDGHRLGRRTWIPSRFPLGRWGQPDDAARLIAWLCSADAEWVTGQVIDSEGGFRRWG